jgi:hypothetical protein
LDAIPFNQRIVFDMESSFGTDIRNPWNLLGYSAVVFWYAMPGATHNRPPQPAAAAQPIQTIARLQAISDAIRFPPIMPNGVPRPRWNLGEQDVGAKAGSPANAITRDANGTNDLDAVGTPIYSANGSGAGSTLSVSFDGSGFYQGQGLGFSNLFRGLDFNNCSISCDVYPTALGASGFSFPFSVGGNGTGFAIVEIGGKWFLINHGVGYSAEGPAVILNAWTHLEVVRWNFGSGVEARLYVNSTYTGISITSTPNAPANAFFIGANRVASGPEGQFRGQIDNVELHDAAPMFLQPPQVSPSTNITAGSQFTLSAMVGGTAPLNFSWFFNGTLLTNSASTSEVRFDHVVPAQSGLYEVIVTNRYGGQTSEVPRINITAVKGLLLGPLVPQSSSGSNRFEIQCPAAPEATYSLWRTLQLRPAAWSNVAVSTPDQNGKLVLGDPFPPSGGAFYRASTP